MGASAMPTASGGTGGPSASPGQVMALMGGLGILAAVALPIAYGALGFVGGLIAAAFYNLIAKFAGGLKFDVEDIGHLPR
ncbi:MAG: hypothetical protein KDM64_00690, partial [Verrucomicrobiae bacterium]|nr:hypothetical protein [Verrucomicrobiae bacterium]